MVNVISLVTVSIVQIIHQIMDQIRHVIFVSEAMSRFLWTISPQRTRWTTFFWIGTRTLIHGDAVWCPPSAIPHVSTVISESFDLWRGLQTASGRQNIRCFRIVSGLEYEQLIHEFLLRGSIARHSFDTCLDRQPELNAKIRAIRIDWLVDVAANYMFRPLNSVLNGV